MQKRFEVGKSYEPADAGFSAITILRRTEKTVWVSNGNAEWRMRIRHTICGDEYVVDSSVPGRFRGEFTFRPDWEVK